MTEHYILEDKTVIPIDDLLTWASWFETADRSVALDVMDDYRISTVFLAQR